MYKGKVAQGGYGLFNAEDASRRLLVRQSVRT